MFLLLFICFGQSRDFAKVGISHRKILIYLFISMLRGIQTAENMTQEKRHKHTEGLSILDQLTEWFEIGNALM